MLCITVAKDDKWANVIASKVIGVSKHIDYAAFHWKAKDVKALKLPLTKFIFVNADGVVDEVILADQLAARGSNFKTAARDSHPLTDIEQWEIEDAIELVRTGAVSQARDKAAVADLIDEQRPDEAEAGAVDAGTSEAENLTGDSSSAAGDADEDASADASADPDADADTDAGADADEVMRTEQADGAESPADLATAVKPSRMANKKKRR